MLLRTENLTKYFNKFCALNNFNIEVEKGTIVGFVGPNGAGKTTAMRIICALMPATYGEVYINDIPASKNVDELKKIIGYVPDYFGVYGNITAREYLDFYADANGIKANERKQLVEDMLSLVNLSEKGDCDVNKLSRGMKQRLCVARALLHDPELLVLDEPASGLDPQARADLKYILRALKEQGKSILISSHILPELGEFSDKVIILKNGCKLAEGSVEQIGEQLGEKSKITYTLSKEEDFEIAATTAKTMEKTGIIIRDGMKLEVEFSGDDDEVGELNRRIILSGATIINIEKTKKSLEQVFLEVIGNENKNSK